MYQISQRGKRFRANLQDLFNELFRCISEPFSSHGHFHGRALSQINRPVFVDMAGRQLSEVCSYISYDEIYELAQEKKLKRMNDTIIDEYSEYIEE